MSALVDLYRVGHDQIVAWVAKTYGISTSGTIQHQNVERARRETMARRLRLYRDKARIDVERIIETIYESAEYQATLKRYVAVARHQNVTRRIVDEIASLYDQPALRTLADASKMERFREEEGRLRLHEIMQESHRLLTLCNEVLLWQFSGVDGQPRLRIVTPDCFDAIPHPADRLVPAAFLIDSAPPEVIDSASRSRLPHYELWDDTYRYLINAHGQMVTATGDPAVAPEAHGLGRIPAVLLHRREPTTTLLDADTGADIESGHLAVALLNVMIMRLSKSQGERQPVLQGNLAAMATGQVMNGERPLLLPPEVTASMLETKTDPTHYLAVKKDVISSLGNTYGMSYEQFSMSEGADLASGKVYQLRREKLSEIRQESRRRAVVNEAEVISLIGFDPKGMSLDYQEQALPLDPTEELSLLRDKMKIGLDSPVAFMQRKDSDLSRKDAIQRMQSNLRDWAMLVLWSRSLNAPMDADAENPGRAPEENGAGNASAPPVEKPRKSRAELRALAMETLNAA